MMRSLLVLVLLVAQESGPEPLPSREVTVADGETVALKIAVSASSRNLVTAVTLPGTAKSVVSAWDPKDLSVEHDGAKLFLKLLAKADGYLDVTTVDGAHLRLRVQPVADRFDSHVIVKLAAKTKPEVPGSGALELIRAMRLGQAPSWTTVARGGDAVLFESAEMKATLLWTYDTGRFRGLVLGLANLSANDPLPIDVTRFQAEGLVLAGSRDLTVPPGGSTRLYLVFSNR